MNELALFAGGGGGILGGLLLGWRTVCAVEINAYARSILLARQKDKILEPFPIWDDIKTFDGHPWRGFVDVVSGGFPCQDISPAGKCAGISGERSGLWAEMARIISEVQPRYALVENSALLVSRGLDVVLADFATMGYDAKWGVFSAANVGGKHKRKRLWIVANNCKKRGPRRPNDEINRCHCNSRRIFSKILQTQKLNWEACVQWESEPGVGRVANGLANNVDKRLAAIGNGQVPAVVKLAWETLINV